MRPVSVDKLIFLGGTKVQENLWWARSLQNFAQMDHAVSVEPFRDAELPLVAAVLKRPS